MRRPSLTPFLSALLFALGILLQASSGRAHIDMVGALKSRGGDQKSSPCDGKRGDGPTYTFEPGAIIQLEIAETIPHPGYYRIAFDDSGDDGFVEPASIKPVDPRRRCPYNDKDQCGESDFCNVVSDNGGASVLWDNLDPHLSADAKDVKYTVKLPDKECENCTIQVIQVMEDVVHGAYCPTGSCTDNSLEDIYHRCIDITIKKGAGMTPGTVSTMLKNNGMECTKQTSPGPTGDAGTPTTDAGNSAPTDPGSAAPADAGAAADAGSSGSTGGKADGGSKPPSAGGSDAGVRDAGARTPSKDAGTQAEDDEPAEDDDGEEPPADDDEEEPEEEPQVADEGGCSAMGPGGSAGTGLELGLLVGVALVLARRKRREARA